MTSRLSRILADHVYRPVVRAPADISAGMGLALVCSALVLGATGPVRAAAGFVLVLFLPGYALVSALFPTVDGIPDPLSGPTVRRLRRPLGSTDGGADRGVDVVERVALSVGASVALAPPVGLVLFGLGVGVDGLTVVASLGSFAVVGLLVASHRRWQFPADERFRVPYRRWGGELREASLGTDSPVDAVLNVAVVLAVALALSSLAYPVLVPGGGESYTEFSVLTESGTGEYVAADYPTDLVRGESAEVVVSVGNHEGTETRYTVVVELQRVDRASGTVLERSRVGRYSTTLADDGRWRRPVTVTPATTGEDLRLTFYLYEGDPPAEPGADTATEHLFVWVDVADPAASTGAGPQSASALAASPDSSGALAARP